MVWLSVCLIERAHWWVIQNGCSSISTSIIFFFLGCCCSFSPSLVFVSPHHSFAPLSQQPELSVFDCAAWCDSEVKLVLQSKVGLPASSSPLGTRACSKNIHVSKQSLTLLTVCLSRSPLSYAFRQRVCLWLKWMDVFFFNPCSQS